MALAASLLAAWGLLAAASAVQCCGGLRFLRVPLLGYLREDLAAAVALVEVLCVALTSSVLAATPRRCRAFLLAVGAILAYKLADAVSNFEVVWRDAWDEASYVESLSAARESEVGEMVGEVMGAAESLRAVALVDAARDLWIHMTSALGTMYFNLGKPHVSFAEQEELKEQDWSRWFLDILKFGFHPQGHLESELYFERVSYAEQVRQWQMSPDVAWLFERFRHLVARNLNVSIADVALGGDDEAPELGRPAFHVYGHSLVWQSLVNPHHDKMYWVKSAGGRSCEKGLVKSFSLSLLVPSHGGGGLMFWDANGRHTVGRTSGALLSWPGDVAHAPQPWAYWEGFVSSIARVSLQGFATRCGDRWVVYH